MLKEQVQEIHFSKNTKPTFINMILKGDNRVYFSSTVESHGKADDYIYDISLTQYTKVKATTDNTLWISCRKSGKVYEYSLKSAKTWAHKI